MTPCEKLGLKVGDTATVLVRNPVGFSVGSVVTLVEDDGTCGPYWSGIASPNSSAVPTWCARGTLLLSSVLPVPKDRGTKFHEFCKDVYPVAQAAINGEPVEWFCTHANVWRPKSDTYFHLGTKYRIKPRTIKVNGFDVPEPMRTKPENDTDYYIPYPIASRMCTEVTWASDSNDERWLLLGICHATADAAVAHAKAMLGMDPSI